VTANVDVIEWPCQSPNISVHLSQYAEPGLTSTVENKHGFTVNATIEVDCMKSNQFTTRWEIIDSYQTTVRTLTGSTQLISEPYALSEGMYVVSVTVTMWSSYFNLSDKMAVASMRVNVTASDLVAAIDGNSFINATFNDMVKLNAYNGTYDSSIQSTSDKSGMGLEWQCKRSSEAWPAQLPTQSYVAYVNGSGGCFGDVGPGVLGFAAGLWELSINTGYLEPLINYDIKFVVRKDVRSTNSNVSLFVQQPLAPVVAVRSVVLQFLLSILFAC